MLAGWNHPQYNHSSDKIVYFKPYFHSNRALLTSICKTFGNKNFPDEGIEKF